MGQLTLTTFDWVPEMPRGYVRDLRVRWALEEAGLPYKVASVPFKTRSEEHFSHQPFGQVPWLTDGDQSLFESGAILFHLAQLSTKLMPEETTKRNDVMEWIFAALNSVEMASLPWAFTKFSDDKTETALTKQLDSFLTIRLQRMETVLAERKWLAGEFSVADILMADVLRLVHRFEGLKDYKACRDYLTRATDRPAFKKAYADQMAHFAAADNTHS